MNEYLIYIFAAFILSLFCGWITTKKIIDFCHKHGLYDIPNSRKVHTNKIPRLGGVCFLPSAFLPFIMAAMLMNINMPEKEITVSLWSVIFLGGLAMIFATGCIDDLVGLNPTVKFIIQIIAASLLPFSGLYINNLYGLFGINDIPFWIGAPLTIFVIVFINNAINLIDGIDGLCAMLSVTALTGFLIGFFTKGVWGYCILIAGLIGVVLAFSYFNILGKAEQKSKIFMGDSGSLTLGYMLGFLAIKYSMYTQEGLVPYHRISLLLSYTLVIVPTYDVCRVILVRLRQHRPIFGADKNHIHHKLLQAGLNQHQTLLTIIALELAYIALNLSLFNVLNYSAIVILDIVVWIAFHRFVDSTISRRTSQSSTGNVSKI